MEVNEAKRLRRVEEENRQLKAMLAEQALDIRMLKDVLSKKLVSPAAKRSSAQYLEQEFTDSESR